MPTPANALIRFHAKSSRLYCNASFQALQNLLDRKPVFFSPFRHPIQGAKEIVVKCDVPAKLVVKAEPRKDKEDNIKYAANTENGRVSDIS